MSKKLLKSVHRLLIEVHHTLCVRDLDVNKINIGSRFFLGSFFIENLNLKKHIINIKTAGLRTDSSKCDGFC